MNTPAVAFQVFFALACMTLLLLPFYPAWQEWRYPTDQDTLGVSPQQTSDVTYLAHAFRHKMSALITGGSRSGYDLVPDFGNAIHATSQAGVHKPIVSAHPVKVKTAVACDRPVYAVGDLDLLGGGSFLELFSEERITLGPRSCVSGWAHAHKAFVLGEDSVAVRRVSSGHSIDLASGCCFERLHAPLIRFGQGQETPTDRLTAMAPPTQLMRDPLPHAELWGANGWRVNADCVIPDGHHFTGSLVITGSLYIGDHAVVSGDIKVRRKVVIGASAQVTGAVISEDSIQILSHAVVGGPVVSETQLLLSTGVQLGSAAEPTTASASSIIAEDGAVAHGTVWARQAGVVWRPL